MLTTEQLRRELRDLANKQPGIDPLEVLTRARRRRMVPRVPAVAAALVVVGLVVAALAIVRDGTPTRVTAGVAAPTDAVVTLTPGRASDDHAILRRLDRGSGDVTNIAVDANNFSDYRVPVLGRGGEIVVAQGGEAVRVDFSARQVRRLVDSLVFAAAADEDAIWSVTTWGYGNRPPFEISLVNVDTGKVDRTFTLPEDLGWPLGATRRHILTIGSTPGTLALVDPAAGSVTTRIADAPQLGGNGWAVGDRVAWLSSCSDEWVCATLHLLDDRTGEERTIRVPSGLAGFRPWGAMNESGSTLAILGATDEGATLQQLLTVRLSDADVRVVPDSTGPTGQMVAWSADGQRVYWSSDRDRALDVWDVSTERTAHISTSVVPFVGLTVTASPSN